MKFEIPIKVDIDGIDELIEELKALQTYRLSEDDEMLLVSLDDVAEIFMNHVVTINDNTADVKVTNCNDNSLIKRQDAIDAIWDGTNYDIYTREVKEILEGLPSAQPETTTWGEKEAIYIDEPHSIIEAWQSMRCSKCERYYTTPYAYYLDEPNYCPYCGRKTERRTDEVYHRV